MACIGLSSLFLQNFSMYVGVDCQANGSLWSLAVEGQFYVLAPLLVAGLTDRQLRALCCILLLGLPLLRIGFGFTASFTPSWFRIEHLALGGWFALHKDDLQGGFGKKITALFGMAAGILLFVGWGLGYRSFHSPIGFSVRLCFTMCAAGLIFLFCIRESSLSRLFASPFFRYLGSRSYGLYLFHQPIGHFFAGHLPGPLAFAGALMAAYGLADLSWRYWESPILALKGRLRGWPQESTSTSNSPKVLQGAFGTPPERPNPPHSVRAPVRLKRRLR